MTQRRPHTEAELVEFVRSIDAPAPESLHRRVESLIARRARERGSAPRCATALVYRALGSTPRLAVAGAGVAAALAVTWLRAGHMCVLSGGGGVDQATLLHLASWHNSVSA